MRGLYENFLHSSLMGTATFRPAQLLGSLAFRLQLVPFTFQGGQTRWNTISFVQQSDTQQLTQQGAQQEDVPGGNTALLERPPLRLFEKGRKPAIFLQGLMQQEKAI